MSFFSYYFYYFEIFIGRSNACCVPKSCVNYIKLDIYLLIHTDFYIFCRYFPNNTSNPKIILNVSKNACSLSQNVSKKTWMLVPEYHEYIQDDFRTSCVIWVCVPFIFFYYNVKFNEPSYRKIISSQLKHYKNNYNNYSFIFFILLEYRIINF